jgi:hypothetical protein
MEMGEWVAATGPTVMELGETTMWVHLKSMVCHRLQALEPRMKLMGLKKGTKLLVWDQERILRFSLKMVSVKCQCSCQFNFHNLTLLFNLKVKKRIHCKNM